MNMKVGQKPVRPRPRLNAHTGAVSGGARDVGIERFCSFRVEMRELQSK